MVCSYICKANILKELISHVISDKLLQEKKVQKNRFLIVFSNEIDCRRFHRNLRVKILLNWMESQYVDISCVFNQNANFLLSLILVKFYENILC